ncbi:MAG: hypothetical protein IT158_20425 [Bryobacterales bacterium]|nr:hypothetical protein [Bryobacterales bacterium]
MLVVVGGHSRNIGKTAVTAAIVRALPEADWTAVKITQYEPGEEAPEKAPGEGGRLYALDADTGPSDTDTGRFLAAGARRAFWLRTARGELEHALPALRRILASSRNVIIESNSILDYLTPDLYLVVVDFAAADFKASARRHLHRADAFVIVGEEQLPPPWNELAGEEWKAKPRFAVAPPAYTDNELAGFVRSRVSESLRIEPSSER